MVARLSQRRILTLIIKFLKGSYMNKTYMKIKISQC